MTTTNTENSPVLDALRSRLAALGHDRQSLQQIVEEHRKLTSASPETLSAIGEDVILEMRKAMEVWLFERGIDDWSDLNLRFQTAMKEWGGLPEDTAIRLIRSLNDPALIPFEPFESVLKTSGAVQEELLELCVEVSPDFTPEIFKAVPQMDPARVWRFFDKLFEKGGSGWKAIGEIAAAGLREPLQSEWVGKMVEADSNGAMVSSFLEALDYQSYKNGRDNRKDTTDALIDILLERDTTGEWIAGVLANRRMLSLDFPSVTPDLTTPERKAGCLEALVEKDTGGHFLLTGLQCVRKKEASEEPVIRSALNKAFERIMELDRDGRLIAELPDHLFAGFWKDIVASGKTFSEKAVRNITAAPAKTFFLSCFLDTPEGEETMRFITQGGLFGRGLNALVSTMFFYREKYSYHTRSSGSEYTEAENRDRESGYALSFADLVFNEKPDMGIFMKNMIALSQTLDEKFGTPPAQFRQMDLRLNRETWDTLFSAVREFLCDSPNRESLALTKEFLDRSCSAQMSENPLPESLSSLLALAANFENEMGGQITGHLSDAGENQKCVSGGEMIL